MKQTLSLVLSAFLQHLIHSNIPPVALDALMGLMHEVMLVVDGTAGGNALNQDVQFHEAIGLTGLTVTKLDGTAKGGVLLAIAKRLALTVRYVGLGEAIDDLEVFDAQAYVEALVGGTPLAEAWALMRKRRLRALPVTDKGRRVLGASTGAALARAQYLDELARLSASQQQQRPGKWLALRSRGDSS